MNKKRWLRMISSVFLKKTENSLIAKSKLLLGLSVFGIFLISLVLISAASSFDFLRIKEGSNTLIQFFVDWASPFLQAILGGNDYTGTLLFEKFLLFVLFFAFIWLSLERITIFKDQKPVKIIIAFVVGVLSIRYMDFMWVNSILQRYEVLGIVVTSFIPFVVYFFFINNLFPDNSTLRKIGWAFFVCIYFGLYFTNDQPTYGEVYFWTGIVSLVFLLMDGTIHRIWLKQLAKENMNDIVRKRIAEIGENIQLLEKYPSPGSKRQVERLRREQEKYMKMIK